MGCNSHLAIEYKPYADGSWWGWASGIPESRDYVMYGVLADVRNSIHLNRL